MQNTYVFKCIFKILPGGYATPTKSCMKGKNRRRRWDMSVNLIFKIAAVGILVSVLSQILKQSGREEHAFLTGIAGLILVLFWLLPYISQLFETVKTLFAL